MGEESTKIAEPGETIKNGVQKEISIQQFHSCYAMHDKLRSGSYGTVFVVKPKHPDHNTNETYAVKQIKRVVFPNTPPTNEEEEKARKKAAIDEAAVFREVQILYDLSEHQGITKLVDFYVQPDVFHVVQIFAEGGDVFDRLAKRQSYTEKDMRDLAVPLLETMKFMHERNIVHRDMKPENLLLQQRNKDSTVLVADFGFAKYVDKSKGCTTRCGTPAFVAPEILMGKNYQHNVDMWSVGCLLYMLLSGYPPFHDKSHRGLFRKIKAGDYVFHSKSFANVSVEAKQLISGFLTVDPEYRNTAANALENSTWLNLDEDSVKTRDLTDSLTEIKTFVARRKFRGMVHAVVFSLHNTKFAIKDNKDFEKQQKEWDKKDLEALKKEQQKKKEKEIAKTKEIIAKAGGMSGEVDTDDTPLLCQINKDEFTTKYKLEEKLSDGVGTSVYECSNIITGTKYACKIIKRNNGNGPPKKGIISEEAVLQEVAVMQNLNFPHIVSLIDFYEEDDCFYLVIDLMRGGDVFDRIIQREQYTEKDARDLTKTLLLALQYLHDKGIAHRDLKPQNLLLTSENDDADIRVADFGHACRVHAPQSITTRCGTPTYVAPEILKNIPYDQSCDLWSVGVILYIMLCGYPPFMEESQSLLFTKIRTGDYTFLLTDWNHISNDAKDLIKGLLQVEPLKRLTATQALNCKWMKEDDKSLGSRDLSASLECMQKRRNRFKTLATFVMATGSARKSMKVFPGMNMDAIKEASAKEEEAAASASAKEKK